MLSRAVGIANIHIQDINLLSVTVFIDCSTLVEYNRKLLGNSRCPVDMDGLDRDKRTLAQIRLDC